MSSSSSENWTPYSQIVLEKIQRTTTKVRASILIDLNMLDNDYVNVTGPLMIDTGGSFSHGVVVPTRYILFADNTRAAILFDRLDPIGDDTKESEVIAEWYDLMLNRIRSNLSISREEGPFLVEAKPWHFRII